jgi:hypothetical protein
MKLVISEKQFKLILSHENLLDEEDAAPSTPSGNSGGSAPSGGGSGYPSVTKWESGVTRGPANQIGVTKWSDIVGNSLKRGNANPLT